MLLPLLALLILLTYSCNYDHTTGPASLFSLTTSASPADGGSVVAPEGEFDEGEEVEIEAVPSDGYRFEQWEGDLSGNENPATLVFDGDKDVTALFTLREHTLTVETEGEGVVHEEVVSERGKTDYEHGTQVRLTAEPATGWRFVRWEGDIGEQDSQVNPLTIDVEEEKTVLAVFERPLESLDIEVVGQGEVREEVVSEKGRTDYVPGTTVRLTAVPDEEWNFVRWEGDVESSENPLEITIEDQTLLTAVFEENTPAGEITVSTDPVTEITSTTAETGGEISVTGELTVTRRGVCWDTESAPTLETDECTHNGVGTTDFASTLRDLSPSTDYFVRAYAVHETDTAYGNQREFTTEDPPAEEYTINVIISGRGSVSLDPDLESWEEGEEVTLTAEPAEGSHFVEWDGDLTGSSNPATLTMDEDKTVIVRFEADQYTLVQDAQGPGTMSVQPDQESYQFGDEVTLSAEPDEGADFTGWSGDASGTENPLVITMDSDKAVTANFELEQYVLTITVNGSSANTVTREPDRSTYTFGEEVTLTAEAADGWRFDRWEGDLTGDDRSEEITMDSDKSVTAVFDRDNDDDDDDDDDDG